MADRELEFYRLIQAAMSADLDWSRQAGVSPLASTRLAEARLENIVRTIVWEARTIRESRNLPQTNTSGTTVRQAVLRELHGQTLNRQELRSKVGSCSMRGLSLVLGQLVHEGLILVTADGRYSLTSDTHNPAPRV